MCRCSQFSSSFLQKRTIDVVRRYTLHYNNVERCVCVHVFVCVCDCVRICAGVVRFNCVKLAQSGTEQREVYFQLDQQRSGPDK